MSKVIDATRIFSCQHEFVALPDHFICHKCDHVRKELPFTAEMRKGLIFFPLSTALEKKAG